MILILDNYSVLSTKIYTFYYPRDALRSAAFAVFRCPSVCQSHADIVYING